MDFDMDDEDMAMKVGKKVLKKGLKFGIKKGIKSAFKKNKENKEKEEEECECQGECECENSCECEKECECEDEKCQNVFNTHTLIPNIKSLSNKNCEITITFIDLKKNTHKQLLRGLLVFRT